MNMDMEKVLIAEQAAEWLIRLETATPEARAEFWDWIRQSPLHAHEVLAAKASQDMLGQLFRGGRIDADKFVRLADNVHEIGNRDGLRIQHDTSQAAPGSHIARLKAALTGAKRARWIITAAALVIALLAATTVALQGISDRRIITGAGEPQTKLLSDGTVLRVGPRTKIVVEFTAGRRLVRLIHGEALFHVAHDAERPFFVATELATARAVGTAFAVSLDGAEQVRVTVKEGIVAVARRPHSRAHRTTGNAPGQSVTLKAGEQVVVATAGSLTAERINVEVALAWAGGQLIFENETVEQAIHEFNRRNELQIRVLDQALLRRPVRGVFDATDPESFAAYLEKQGAVVVMGEEPGTLLIAPYPAAATAETAH